MRSALRISVAALAIALGAVTGFVFTYAPWPAIAATFTSPAQNASLAFGCAIDTFLKNPLNVVCYGAKGDGVTDDTAAIQAAIDSLMGAAGNGTGGTIFFPSGTYLVSGQLAIRNDGQAANPHQPFLRLTGWGANFNGRLNGAVQGGISAGASALDLRVNAAVAKIETRGLGVLEIDHLILKDGGADSAIFLRTTNTTLRVHDNVFIGTAAGSSAVNDAIVLGGTETVATQGSNGVNSSFQGYGTLIQGNLFSQIRKVVLFQSSAQGVQFVNNTIGLDCGSATANDAPIMLVPGAGATAAGNFISGNLIESANYTYGIYVGGSAASNVFLGNTIWDKGASTVAGVLFASGGNVFIGYIDGGFTSGNKVVGSMSNTFLDTTYGAVDTNLPVMRSPTLVPIYFSPYSPTNAGSFAPNANGAVTHNVIAGAGVASFTVNAPTINAGTTGAILNMTIRNTSGGVLAVTWDAIYKMAAWANLANGFNRSITFYYNGTVWVELSRTPADVPN